MSSRLARKSSVAALVAGTFALIAPSAASAAPLGGTAGAAHYLAGELAAGGHGIKTTSGGVTYADTGMSADSILALGATGTSATETSAALTKYTSDVSSYVGTGGEQYAGATAKSIIVAVAGGQNPANFGGIDLVAQLKGLETASGRFSDKSAYGDYTNGFTQPLALIAEKRAGVGPDASAVKYLLSQQCANGGFAMALGATTCTSDPDATSLAVQALAAVGGQGASIAKADAYLRSVQGADGGVIGGVGASSENSNSTGLAAVAFTLAGDGAAATKAKSFVNSLQYGCAAPASLRGAIAYNKADFAGQSALGAKATGLGNEARATAQAIFAFVPTSYATVTTTASSAAVPAPDCSTSTSTPTTVPTTSSSTSSTSAPATSPVSTSPTKASSSTAAPSSSTSTSATVPSTAVPTATQTSGSSSASSTSGAPAVATSSSSAATTGPKVDTDKVGNGSNDLAFALAGASALLAGGGAVAFARRR